MARPAINEARVVDMAKEEEPKTLMSKRIHMTWKAKEEKPESVKQKRIPFDTVFIDNTNDIEGSPNGYLLN